MVRDTSATVYMNRFRLPRVRVMLVVVCALTAGASVDAKNAKKKDGNKRNTLLDKQMKLNRQECEQELERKGHDDPCNAEPIHRENCLLRCASPACYEQLYAHDPLEEGEVDTVRGRSFRSCQRTEIKEKQKEESKLAKEGAKNL